MLLQLLGRQLFSSRRLLRRSAHSLTPNSYLAEVPMRESVRLWIAFLLVLFVVLMVLFA